MVKTNTKDLAFTHIWLKVMHHPVAIQPMSVSGRSFVNIAVHIVWRQKLEKLSWLRQRFNHLEVSICGPYLIDWSGFLRGKFFLVHKTMVMNIPNEDWKWGFVLVRNFSCYLEWSAGVWKIRNVTSNCVWWFVHLLL